MCRGTEAGNWATQAAYLTLTGAGQPMPSREVLGFEIVHIEMTAQRHASLYYVR